MEAADCYSYFIMCSSIRVVEKEHYCNNLGVSMDQFANDHIVKITVRGLGVNVIATGKSLTFSGIMPLFAQDFFST